ncbi:MAG: chorismate-binding protein, partial [Ramlibacter sp.]|nr:chorismate-binding protein [Ramlibacter sp.]
PEPASRAGPDRSPGDAHPPGGDTALVRRAVRLLREPSRVSLTLRQSYRRRVTLPAAQAFARLRAVNPAPASLFLNDGSGERLFGASPDLQLAITAGRIQAFPVCGTVARRAGAVGEAQSLRELLNEEVDAASLAVCTDALRNDLAALCEPGSLQLRDRRRPMSLATVVHAVDRLEGRLRPGCDAWDAIVATAAPVMVTGTPRAAALAAIAQLEASPRGWYGGLMVQVASNGDALAGTILRAAAVSNGVAEVRTGGDLMVDSSPEREEQESRLKTLSVWRAFGLEPEPEPAGVDAVAVGGPGALRLLDHGDPFGQSVRDCVLGLGIGLSDAATTTLAIGAGAASGATAGLVAIGDAAYEVLAHNGFAVERQAPEHGRTLLATATPQAPWRSSGPFIVARYAGYRLANASMPGGWETWAVDGNDAPLILVERGRRIACLLFRPDSLLCEPQALSALRASISLAGSNAQ